MEITIIKLWQSEVTISIPDDKEHDKDYLACAADAHIPKPTHAVWDSTYITNADTDEELADW